METRLTVKTTRRAGVILLYFQVKLYSKFLFSCLYRQSLCRSMFFPSWLWYFLIPHQSVIFFLIRIKALRKDVTAKCVSLIACGWYVLAFIKRFLWFLAQPRRDSCFVVWTAVVDKDFYHWVHELNCTVEPLYNSHLFGGTDRTFIWKMLIIEYWYIKRSK